VTLGLALVLPSRAWLRTPGGRFALVTALAGYAPALIAGEGNLGAARNWDLFAGPSLVLPVLGLLLVLALPESRPRSRILVAALAASAFVCVPWTALNMDLARTEARVAALPLGHGRGAAMLGTRALNAGDLARAERLFTSALAQDSLNLNAWSGLGLARARAGRWSEALEPLARAAELGAGAPQYRRDLAVLHMRLERWASASADWQQLLSSAPADRAAWFGLAEAQSRLGHADSSAWALAAAAERLPGDAEVSRALADAYARWVATCGVRGDRLGFALAWGTFTRRFPDDPRVSQWRARAEALLAPR
jgi:Flp pilus assembly protein TadD